MELLYSIIEALRGRSSVSERDPAKMALWVLAGAAVGAIFVAGITYLFYPEGHSRITGTLFLLVSASLMFLTMHKWLVGFVAMLASGVLISLLAIASGHIAGPASLMITPLQGFALLLFGVISGLLLLIIRSHELTAVDRTAVMIYMLVIGWAMVYDGEANQFSGNGPPRRTIEFPAMAVAVGVLGLACLIRLMRRRKHQHHIHRPDGS
jgi:hypothetical protein